MEINDEKKTLAVVVASGGLDSCVVAALVSSDCQPAMLHAQYRQKTSERELQAFHDVSDALGIRRRLVIQLDHFHLIGGSSLTDNNIEVPVDGVHSGVIPTTYVPFRNANLLAAAVSWAEVIGAGEVYIGINHMDSSGYPDCTPAFLDAFNQLIEVGTRPETHIVVKAPLLGMTKQQIVRLGLDIGAPMHKSWSCYTNSQLACGVCDSCRLRLAGFNKNNATDPIAYDRLPG